MTRHAFVIFLVGLVCAGPLAAMLKHIERVTPRIGQRGTTVEVVIQGAHLQDPREIIFFRPGIRAVSVEPMPKLERIIGLAHGGRIEDQVRCRFEIAPDCPPGEHAFRLRTATQLSSLATFHVTPFPVVDEQEEKTNANDTPSTATAVGPNVTVRGLLGSSARGDTDVYRVPVSPGQRLSVEIDCVRLADVHYGDSEFDLAVRVLDSKGRELASNDENSLHLQDPLLSLRVPPDAGDHVFVEMRRSVFTPREVAYAAHIGSFFRPLAAYPSGGPAGEALSVRWLGDPLGEAEARIEVPGEPGTFQHFGEAPSGMLLRSFGGPNVLEKTGSVETAVPALPAALNGILDQPGDTDAFRVSVKKGDRFRVRVYASTLGSPLDPALSIRFHGEDRPEVSVDDADSTLADRDIHGPSIRSRGGLKDVFDPSVIWEPKQDGEYLIEMRDTNGFGSPTGVYRVEIEPPADTVFALLRSAAFDWAESGRFTSLAVPKGNRWTFNLSLPVGQGTTFQGDLRVIASGLPSGVELVSPVVPG